VCCGRLEARGPGNGLPHTLLVGRDGVVSDVFTGYWQERDAYVRERVQELLEASPST
jgi:hypothetical protein